MDGLDCGKTCGQPPPSRGPAARPRSPHPFAKELFQDAWHRGLGSNRRRAKQNASVYLTEVE